jgi:hypothetical protein
MHQQNFRQIHLDFHTSPYISDVGISFDSKEFATVLKKAHVDSVNIFSRCHHGYCFYPTKIGIPHPSLQRDLLGEMIDALRKYGIKCPVYTTVVWDELSASNHPEWRQVDTEGKLVGRSPFSNKGWRFLCMNAPDYLDYLVAQVEEVMDWYHPDGFWFDIIVQHPDGCLCQNCIKSMKDMGLHPDRLEDRLQHNLIVERKAMKRLFSVVKDKNPNASIVFNNRFRLHQEVEKGVRPELINFSHLEIESLPSGEWGYLHFPIFARYFSPLNVEIIGMTGRFHASWGDFGGLKNKAALEYECFRMLSLGAKCSIGDQLHPRGKLDRPTYQLIGEVYSSIEAKEPWCQKTKLLADIGVLVNTKADGAAGFSLINGLESDEGAFCILNELHYQFHIIDSESDLKRYKLIVAPDGIILNDNLKDKLKNYLAQGGAFLYSYESGLDPDKKNFALSELGLTYLGNSPYDREFVRLKREISQPLMPDFDYVLYEKGSKIEVLDEGEVLAWAVHPYFNRTWEKFCSHSHTPPNNLTDEPVIFQKGKTIYITHPIFMAYRNWGYKVYKIIVENCLKRLLRQPLLISDALPSFAEVTMLQQNERKVIHLLCYIQKNQGKIDIIEDIYPLENIPLKVFCSKKPKMIILVPQDNEIQFSWANEYAEFVVPKVIGHQMIVIE